MRKNTKVVSKPTSKPKFKLPKIKRSLGIRAKLVAGFMAVTFLLLCVFGVGYFGINYIAKAADKVAAAQHEQLLWTSWSSRISSGIADYEYYFLSGDETWLNTAQTNYQEVDKISKISYSFCVGPVA